MSEGRGGGAELEEAGQGQILRGLTRLCKDVAFILGKVGSHWKVLSRPRV